MTSRIALVGILLGVASAQLPVSADPAPSALQRAQNLFAKADADGDQQLSVKEFIACQAKADVARRDFRLFDTDQSGTLSLQEFLTCPSVMPPTERGALYDPMQEFVDQAQAAMDEAVGRWDQNPRGQLPVQQFLAKFSSNFAGVLSRINHAEVDLNGDERVSRQESRQFLETQLGIRRPDGQFLRKADGRVVNHMLYLHIDQNRNDRLERDEYLERSYSGDQAAAQFETGDANKDGWLTFDEYCSLATRSHDDPIAQFRQYDTNLDAFVDADELQAGLPEWKQKLGGVMLPAFDLDGDGRLSLSEYRVTPVANMILPWHTISPDRDGDEEIPFTEFHADQALFPLLRLVYFHRLDRNRNQVLSPDEYPIPKKTPDSFYIVDEDGSDWRLFFHFEGYNACGSAAVSPDGKWLAFDGWTTKPRGASTMFVMPMSGGEPRSLGSGMMPNWSADSSQLTFSRSGICTIHRDGTQPRTVTQGWGAQWSPDGKRIAFTDGAKIKTYDVATEEIATLLGDQDNPFQSVYWNMGWSPDSRRICFKASRADGSQDVAIIDAVPGRPNLQIRHSGKIPVNADFAWHPRGDRIVYAMRCVERNRQQLYEFHPDDELPPKLFEGQPTDLNHTDCCWTPDGKHLIVVSGDF